MELSIFKEQLIFIFSIISCIGVPTMVFFIIKFNQKEVSIIKTFSNDDIFIQLKEYQEEQLNENRRLYKYCQELEKNINEISISSNELIIFLKNFKKDIEECKNSAKKNLSSIIKKNHLELQLTFTFYIPIFNPLKK